MSPDPIRRILELLSKADVALSQISLLRRPDGPLKDEQALEEAHQNLQFALVAIADIFIQENKEASMAGLQHVSVSYPTYEQGADSLLHLGKAALGQEPTVRNDMIAQAWIALGAGLGQVLPTAGPMKAVVFPEEFKAYFAEQCRMHTDGTGRIDWKALLPKLLPFLLAILSGL